MSEIGLKNAGILRFQLVFYLYGIEHCLCFVNQKLKLYLHPLTDCALLSTLFILFYFYFKHATISIRLFTKEYSYTITGCLLNLKNLIEKV